MDMEYLLTRAVLTPDAQACCRFWPRQRSNGASQRTGIGKKVCSRALQGSSVGGSRFWRRQRRYGASERAGIGKKFCTRALQESSVGGGGGRRLVDVVRRIPAAVDGYFNESPFRRPLWGGISLLGGFYVAQTISLSFGVLGVNDVIAAVLCVLFTEYVTRYYYTRPGSPSFYVALLNNFKMGFSYGLFIDAFKLAS